MLNVFITVDTESWPSGTNVKGEDFLQAMHQDIYGITSVGEFGIRYQIELLNRYGLKACFLLESLSADLFGRAHLSEIVKVIQEGGHEVQLHIHTEWLERIPDSMLPGRTGQHIRNFTEDEQTQIISRGLENLRGSGAKNVCAFRAGNFGANFDTLRALARNGITYDTSHNTCFLGAACDMPTPTMFMQPKNIGGVYEFPVSFFRDRWSHFRPAHINACSTAEMEHALLSAWKQGWSSFVVVSHSFELIHRRRKGRGQPRPNYIVVKRFEKLCQFLADNRDKFTTTMFSYLDPQAIPCELPAQPIQSNLFRTAQRYSEQLLSRMF